MLEGLIMPADAADDDEERGGGDGTVPAVVARFTSVEEANDRIHAIGRSAIYNKERKAWLCQGTLDDMTLDGIVPNRETYVTLVSTAMKLDRLDKVLEYFDLMRSAGHVPDVTVYNAVLTSIAKTGNMDLAFHMVERMQREGMTANMRTYCILLIACSVGGDSGRAFKLYDSMLAAGIEPNAYIYSALLGVCRTTGLKDKADEFFAVASKTPYGATIQLHNAMLACCVELGDIAGAYSLFTSMVREGISPNVITYSFLLKGFLLYKQTDSAIELHERMRARRIVPTRLAYDYILRLYASAGLIDRVVATFREMKSVAKSPYIRTVQSVVAELAWQKRPDALVRVWRVLRDDKQRIGLTSLSYLMEHIGSAPEHAEGVREIAAELNAALALRDSDPSYVRARAQDAMTPTPTP